MSLIILALATPAFAASLKSIMGSMGDTTKAAKAVLTTFDPIRAQSILQTYAKDAQAADAAFASARDAKARDLHARFIQFAATVEAAKASVGNRSGFHTALVTIVNECRSCHSAYK